MQNRYVSDVGDFGKYGLLRTLVKTGLVLGVNWYLVPNESHNSDGKHTSYLNDSAYNDCDEELRSILKEILSMNNRNVESIKKSEIFPSNTVYFENILYFPPSADWLERIEMRKYWHNAAMERMNNCDLIFLDPDNGLQVKSISIASKKGNKYLALNELQDYYSLGKSIVFYNHRERKPEEQYLNKFRKLKEYEVFKGASILGLKFRRGTIRDYIFVLQPEHTQLIKKNCEILLSSKWNEHFSKLDI